MHCKRCNGTGKIPNYFSSLGGEDCPDCGGGGYIGVSNVSARIVDTYTVTVGNFRTIEDAIRAGKYYRVNDEFTQYNFPNIPFKRETVELQVIDFKRRITAPDIICELNRMGLRAANIWELLALGAENSLLHVIHQSVVALGSHCYGDSGDQRFPFILGFYAKGRSLKLSSGDGQEIIWSLFYRFLAVKRKII